jgi:ligand-binding sensor domain-containing protein
MWFRALPVILPGLLGLAFPSACVAVTTTAYEGFLIKTWQTEDGLPQNSVTSITQSRDGYLWVATYGGMARFAHMATRCLFR